MPALYASLQAAFGIQQGARERKMHTHSAWQGLLGEAPGGFSPGELPT